jgi:hypothetical protein
MILPASNFPYSAFSFNESITILVNFKLLGYVWHLILKEVNSDKLNIPNNSLKSDTGVQLFNVAIGGWSILI